MTKSDWLIKLWRVVDLRKYGLHFSAYFVSYETRI